MTLPDDRRELKREYLSWLNRTQTRAAELVPGAIDALYDVAAGNGSDASIEALRRGLEGPHIISYALGEHVSWLANRWPALRGLLLELCEHRRSAVRCNAMVLCSYVDPAETTAQMLRRGLHDRSKKVRLLAADKILATLRVSLVADLLRVADTEGDTEVERTLRWTADLLHQGWSSRGVRPNRVDVLIETQGRGGVAGLEAREGEPQAETVRRAAELRATWS